MQLKLVYSWVAELNFDYFYIFWLSLVSLFYLCTTIQCKCLGSFCCCSLLNTIGVCDKTPIQHELSFDDRNQLVLYLWDGIDAIEDAICHIETYDVITIRSSIHMFILWLQ